MAHKYVLVALVAFLCIEALSAFRLNKRAVGTSDVEVPEICQGRSPCGWAVYNKLTRYIEYFMRNKCECPKEQKCLRDDDDISITAYVYRCKFDKNAKNTS